MRLINKTKWPLIGIVTAVFLQISKACRPLNVTDGFATYSQNETALGVLENGTTATLSCDDNPEQHRMQFQCTESGQWSPSNMTFYCGRAEPIWATLNMTFPSFVPKVLALTLTYVSPNFTQYVITERCINISEASTTDPASKNLTMTTEPPMVAFPTASPGITSPSLPPELLATIVAVDINPFAEFSVNTTMATEGECITTSKGTTMDDHIPQTTTMTTVPAPLWATLDMTFPPMTPEFEAFIKTASYVVHKPINDTISVIECISTTMNSTTQALTVTSDDTTVTQYPTTIAPTTDLEEATVELTTAQGTAVHGMTTNGLTTTTGATTTQVATTIKGWTTTVGTPTTTANAQTTEASTTDKTTADLGTSMGEITTGHQKTTVAAITTRRLETNAGRMATDAVTSATEAIIDEMKTIETTLEQMTASSEATTQPATKAEETTQAKATTTGPTRKEEDATADPTTTTLTETKIIDATATAKDSTESTITTEGRTILATTVVSTKITGKTAKPETITLSKTTTDDATTMRPTTQPKATTEGTMVTLATTTIHDGTIESQPNTTSGKVTTGITDVKPNTEVKATIEARTTPVKATTNTPTSGEVAATQREITPIIEATNTEKATTNEKITSAVVSKVVTTIEANASEGTTIQHGTTAERFAGVKRTPETKISSTEEFTALTEAPSKGLTSAKPETTERALIQSETTPKGMTTSEANTTRKITTATLETTTSKLNATAVRGTTALESAKPGFTTDKYNYGDNSGKPTTAEQTILVEERTKSEATATQKDETHTSTKFTTTNKIQISTVQGPTVPIATAKIETTKLTTPKKTGKEVATTPQLSVTQKLLIRGTTEQHKATKEVTTKVDRTTKNANAIEMTTKSPVTNKRYRTPLRQTQPITTDTNVTKESSRRRIQTTVTPETTKPGVYLTTINRRYHPTINALLSKFRVTVFPSRVSTTNNKEQKSTPKCPKPMYDAANSKPIDMVDSYDVGDRVQVECLHGYIVPGERDDVICQPDGNWTNEIPHCKAEIEVRRKKAEQKTIGRLIGVIEKETTGDCHAVCWLHARCLAINVIRKQNMVKCELIDNPIRGFAKNGTVNTYVNEGGMCHNADAMFKLGL